MDPVSKSKLRPLLGVSVASNNGAEITITSEKQLALTNIIKIYFEFMYYMASCPFRLVRDAATGHYQTVSWIPQKILCGTLHILNIFVMVAEIRASINENASNAKMGNPYPYFQMTLTFCSLIYKLATVTAFWRKKHFYLKILNFILKEESLPLRHTFITQPFCIRFVFGAVVLKVVACLISGYGMIAPIWIWSPSLWMELSVGHAHYTFLFAKSIEAVDINNLSGFDVCLVILVTLGKFERYILAEACDLCILVVALTLWCVANSFASDIGDALKMEDTLGENVELSQFVAVHVHPVDYNPATTPFQNHSPWPLFYRNFQAVQSLSGIINDALGSQVTWYMAEGLMYYSIHVNAAFLTKDNFKRFLEIMFCVLTFGILYISADICNKMATVKQWLVRNNNIKTVPVDEANLVLHEVITKDIGIQGSNIFTITFPLVAGFLSLFVTFFVICVQSQT